MSTPSNRIPSLDGLRAISIFLVIMAHASSHFSESWIHIHSIRTSFALLSYFGVTIFFVISGFLITSLLIAEYSKNGRICLTEFYKRRSFRILPASLLYIGIVAVLGSPSINQLTYALTFTTTYFYQEAYTPLQHLWSLSVEEQFYLLWPLVFATGIRRAKLYCWVLLLAAPILRFALFGRGFMVYSHFAPAIADSVTAGCLLAFYQDNVSEFVRKYFRSTVSFVALSAGTALVAGELYRAHLVLLWGLIPCLIALIISAAIERKGAFLNSAPLIWVGLLSYSLYLWQQPFLVFDGPFNNLFVRLFLTLFMAYASYRFIEQPILQLRSKKTRGKLVTDAQPSASLR
jgi:peptidoglycan/LPS O-acetylase OafA/YrhL